LKDYARRRKRRSTYKLATRYRVAYFPAGAKAGKTDIIVVLEGSASHTYKNLAL
jgi:hypothetical protein